MLLLCSAAGAAEPQWVEVRSPNFSVVTDAGEKRGREVALRFEQMRAAFGTLILRKSVSIPVPLQILAFRNSRGLRQVVPIWKGKPVDLAGLFQPGEDRNFIALDLSAESKWETVFHEYAHMLLNANFPRTQLWFDEGFAEYYATIQIGSKDVQVGAPRVGSVYTLQRNSWMRVVDLFSIAHGSKEYNETGDRRSIFYAQSWLMTHYLFDTRKLKEASTYFDLVLNRGLPIDQAIRQAFGLEPKKLDDELRRFFSSDQALLYTFQTPISVETANTYRVRPLGPPDVKAVMADMHLHSPHYFEQGATEFEEVLQLQPDNAAAHRGLGYAFLRKNDLDQADLHFRRAAELNADDPRVHYFAAMLMSRQAFGPSGQVEKFREMTAHLEKSISLNPEFADAHNLLAMVHLWQREPERAIASFKRALELSPRVEHYAVNLAQAYVAARQMDEAKALLQHLQNSNDPTVAQRATDDLARLEIHSSALPMLQAQSGPVSETAESVTQSAPAHLDRRPVESLEGRLLAVECSETSAIVTILSGNKTWKLRVRDREKVILIGVDDFDCAWRDQDVIINYRPGSENEGDVATLEIRVPEQERVPLKRK
ncbi:MAG TPA: tetratricopeptide repeat protein [Terriglobales bacterium]|nr:tetratricopeptide repeat protein [Terriglobales bacterium]